MKFNSNFEVSDTSTFFPSITGEEFSFFDILTSEGEVEGASSSYTLGTDGPGITGFAVFSAGDFLLYDSSEFTFDSGVFSGSFTTAGLGNNPNNPTPGLHITFFDTAAPDGPGNGGGETPAPIPLPAGGLLMLTGLAGLAAFGGSSAELATARSEQNAVPRRIIAQPSALPKEKEDAFDGRSTCDRRPSCRSCDCGD